MKLETWMYDFSGPEEQFNNQANDCGAGIAYLYESLTITYETRRDP